MDTKINFKIIINNAISTYIDPRCIDVSLSKKQYENEIEIRMGFD